MKIGVFGDSFAGHTGDLETKQKRWTEHLQEMRPDWYIGNHGFAGSSLYWTYNQIRQHEAAYDKLIVIYTNPNRLWLPKLTDYNIEHCYGYHYIMRRENRSDWDPKSILAKKMAPGLKFYYQYICDEREQNLYWKLLVEEIRNMPNVELCIPAMTRTANEPIKASMTRIADIDHEIFKVNVMKDDFADLRACHMNQKNNIQFAKRILEHFDDIREFDINLKEYGPPDADELVIGSYK